MGGAPGCQRAHRHALRDRRRHRHRPRRDRRLAVARNAVFPQHLADGRCRHHLAHLPGPRFRHQPSRVERAPRRTRLGAPGRHRRRDRIRGHLASVYTPWTSGSRSALQCREHHGAADRNLRNGSGAFVVPRRRRTSHGRARALEEAVRSRGWCSGRGRRRQGLRRSARGVPPCRSRGRRATATGVRPGARRESRRTFPGRP